MSIKKIFNFVAQLVMREDVSTKVESQVEEILHIMGNHIVTYILLIEILLMKNTNTDLHSGLKVFCDEYDD